MKSNLLAVIALVFLTAHLSSAVSEDDVSALVQAMLKVENPNELPLLVESEDDCPISENELTEIASGVLIRSRIKPLPAAKGEEWLERELLISVRLQCVEGESTGGSQIYKTEVRFGTFNKMPPVFYPLDYAFLGRGGKDYMVAKAKEGVERAITAFIKANFDL